jgi:hypothetical protein
MKTRILLTLIVLLIFSLGNFLQTGRAGVGSALVQTGPTLRVNDVSIAEGNSGTQQLTFTVTLTGAHGPVFVRVDTADGTPPNGATAPGDYVSNTQFLDFPAGEAAVTRSFAVTINGDTSVEPDETFFVNLSNADGAVIGDAQGVGTITNDDTGTSCGFSINPTSRNFSAGGGSGSVVVTTTAGCNWTATSNAPWITISGTTVIPTGGTVNYSVAANPGGGRSGTMTIAGHSFSVQQDGVLPMVSISNASVIEGDSGADSLLFTVTLSAPVAFPVAINYQTADNTAMITDNDYSAASGVVTFPANSIAPQTISVAVIGDIRAEPDEQLLVSLSNPPPSVTISDGRGIGTIVNDDNLGNCAYSISPLSQAFPAHGGEGAITVTAPAGCNWSAASNQGWISINSGASGAANGVVSFTVAPNNASADLRARAGSITVANKTFSITQAGTSCEFLLSPSTQIFPSGSTIGTFQVQAASDCEWLASVQFNDQGFPVEIVSEPRGRGPGSVRFLVPANPTIFERRATLILQNRQRVLDNASFEIRQRAAGSDCSPGFSPENLVVDEDGGGASINVTVPPDCNVAATTTSSWIEVVGPQIAIGGILRVQLLIQRNRGSWRAGAVNIGNRQLWIYQETPSCPVEIICAYFPAACPSLTPPSTVNEVREFRDQLLAKTSRGQNYTRLYYQAADEAARILTLNPMLLLRSSEILQQYKPVLEAMSRGEQVTLSEGDVEEIENFLNSFAEKGSPELRQSIERVRHDLRDAQVRKEFNINVIKGEKRQSSSSRLSGRKLATGFALVLGFCPLVAFGYRRRREVAKGAKLLLLFALSTALADVMPLSSVQARPRPRAAGKRLSQQTPAQANQAYAKLPLVFEPNVGQAEPQTQFVARGRGYTLALKPAEARLALKGQKASLEGKRQKAKGKRQNYELPEIYGESAAGDSLGLRLLNPDPAAKIEGLDELGSRSNYFIGSDPARWRAGVANYARVKSSGVYKGVDVIYYGNGGELEYDFKVAAGADPGVIALRFEGAERIELAAGGELVLQMADGEVRQHKPVAYQEINGVKKAVACSYRWLNEGESRRSRNSASEKTGLQTSAIGFAVGKYDPSQPLIIDPLLVYSTYLGGGGGDEGNSITVDAAGNAYVAGFTGSNNFPTLNPAQPAQGGGQQDAFVAKLNPAGNALLYSTYFGGDGQENASGIAVDAAGNAYVTGYTGSANFPVKEALQADKKGSSNAFVVKLNASGGLLYATHLGGTGSDAGTGIAVDAAGNVYVAGIATSADFPLMNAVQTDWGGAADVFVAKLNAAGNQLLFSTYLGAGSSDAATSLAIDAAGNVYVTGVTTSRNWQTASALQANHGGGLFDVFVARFNTLSHQLVYSTYLGGSGEDRAFRIAVDAAGNAYITGDTDSGNFPTVNALQGNFSGGTDAFVAKLNASGSALVYSTYLGGSGLDGGTAVAVDAAGEAYVTGFTASKNFPTVSPLQPENAGGSFDAFVAKFNAAGSQLDYSTYLGGANIDSGFGLAVDGAGNAFVMGVTTSQNFPTTNPLQAHFGGGAADLFVARIASGLQLSGASISGKGLTVFGAGFDSGAKILVNGQEQKTANDPQNPATVLRSPKAAKRMPPGQTSVIQVRNADGRLSNQLSVRR